MNFEQKLAISKIWAKKSTKNRKKWGFSVILGGQKFNDYSYLITSTSIYIYIYIHLFNVGVSVQHVYR